MGAAVSDWLRPPQVQTVSYRRAALFLVDIGVPVTVAYLVSQPAGGLLGCVCGLLFSFADEEGPLAGRYRILALAGFAMALGGAAGAFWSGFAWPLWPLFIAATFASGAFIGFGKAPTLACRFGAMALVVVSGTPHLQFVEVAFAATAFVTVVLVRTVDHALFGPLPHLRGGAPRAAEHHRFRFAFAYTAVATISLWLGSAIDPSRSLWVVVTTLVVMQPDARASYIRIVERIAGTALGVVAAFAVTSIVHAPAAIGFIILIVALSIPHHLQHRYWLHTALIALLILLAYDLAASDPRILHGLFTERLQDVLLGGALALVGTFVAFPRKVALDELD
jgi:hypothetical protein